MDHRERVLTAINHQQPDRLPTAIWGSAYGITDSQYFELLKKLKLGDPILPFRRRLGHTVNYYDDPCWMRWTPMCGMCGWAFPI